MNFVSADNLSKSYGDKNLFSGLSFGMEKGQKIALVARNGAGKTTLLRIIAGAEQPDTGEVRINKDIRWAWLEQEPAPENTGTVRDYIFSGSNPVLQALNRYQQALEAYEQSPDEKHLENLQKATEDMEVQKAWDTEAMVQQILGGFGIYDLNKPVNTLSGGQKKRMALSRLLIEEPELLILDEPTNHLDLDMVEWLEGYLSRQNLSLLLVTHDRYFLDSICNEIAELDNGQLYRHKGNYTDYLGNKAEREGQQARETDKARNLLRKELEWARRMPKARGTKAKYRMDAVEELKAKAAGKQSGSSLDIQTNMSRLGKKIMEIQHLHKSFGENSMVQDFSYVFKRGEKIGIVGKNGVGKSTFLNILTGQLLPDAGEIDTGETVRVGYYTQKGIDLPEDKRVIEVVQDIAEHVQLADNSTLSATQLLQRFLFEPEKQYSYVSTLSGGEQRRLYLLTVLVQNPNFLILDEPTNDLDLLTLNVLEDFLDEFPGCVMVVTHDRYFLDRIADHLFIFEGKGKITDFNGRFLEYREFKKELELKERQEKKEESKSGQKAKAKDTRRKNRDKKLSYNEQKEYDSLEKQIELLETEKTELAQQLASGITDYEKLQQISEQIEALGQNLEQKMTRWMELSEKAGDD